ncbi:conserved unknown protein [Ectocarpus siliculosus]|uniref:Uncharacterized protein n=1 Tax=Ectocarpus siliculosus TaxID=2880 RepID=D7FZL7_ECTSI|nr:conserved unknown protein [Ectocarpus siliculosus]|eukprot:CBJ32824.1 conserved unknown protein [Ectocarpus siliculosus]
MDASAETAVLRRQLEKAVSAEDVERIADVLGSLGKVEVTLAVLQESKVGATVSKLKKHADEEVSKSAKALVKKWKRVAEASGVQGAPAAAAGAAGKTGKSPPGSAGKGSGASKQEVPSPSGGGGAGPSSGTNKAAAAAAAAGGATAATSPLKGAVGKTATSSTSEAVPLSRQTSGSSTSELCTTLEVDSILSDDEPAPLRLKMRRKMFDTLLLGSSEDERIPTARVAKGVECAMNENNPYLSKKASYLDKARQLVFNLKKNDQLRQDVREGLVEPQRLVAMTSTELMAKDKREAMDKAVSERTEARMLDWYDKNEDKINKQCGIKETDGMFECGRCKSTKTTYTQKQTRSADEPMTTFVTCSNCKNRWKFC